MFNEGMESPGLVPFRRTWLPLDCLPLRGREGLPLERFVKKREEAPGPRAEAG